MRHGTSTTGKHLKVARCVNATKTRTQKSGITQFLRPVVSFIPHIYICLLLIYIFYITSMLRVARTLPKRPGRRSLSTTLDSGVVLLQVDISLGKSKAEETDKVADVMVETKRRGD